MFYGKTKIVVCQDDKDLGLRAVADVSKTMKKLLALKGRVRMVFAAAESQVTFLDALAEVPGIDWQRVEAFNMDDLWDPRMLPACACFPLSEAHLYKKVNPGVVHYIHFNAPDPQAEAVRFEKLLRARPLDITCQGIGRSGHIALNEPGDTDFADPRWVRVVRLCAASKAQLMDDPHFKKNGPIPDQGITMTLPALCSARFLFTIVPYASKREIISKLLLCQKADPALPASILFNTPGTLYLDKASCSL